MKEAIALSLSIEEEKLRQIAEELPIPQLPTSAGFISAPLVPLPPKPFTDMPVVQVEPMAVPKKPWGFTSAPLMSRPHLPPAPPPAPADPPAAAAVSAPAAVPRLPGRAGFISSPLCRAPRRVDPPAAPSETPASESAPSAPPPPPPPPEPEQEEEPSVAGVEKYRANLALWRRRASQVAESSPRAAADAAGFCLDDTGPSAEERRRRAEHLKQQRDRLLERRTQERTQQMHDFTSASAAMSSEDYAALGRRRVAELSGAVRAEAPGAVPPEAAEKLRQTLTRQLLQSLAASIPSDASTLEDQLSQLESMRWDRMSPR
ncbi:unnamed protein product [Effrenium voratum]|uniref:Uncharacterized protein n=1 Tax=Effrenium voratum TaxID=2562239 RepID=A0AA36NBP8_9DINO|nr:unnamed protein product [Effrenium voratum]CAJ1396503.1 unnamed protein product [Effrenium voratum]